MRDEQYPEMATLIRRVADQWATEGVSSNGGTSLQVMADFSSRNDVRLPSDLAAFVLDLNGSRTEDAKHLHLWSIERWETVVDSPKKFIFGDYLAASHVFAVDLGGEPHGVIELIGDVVPRKLCDSFRAFLKLYVEDPSALSVPTP